MSGSSSGSTGGGYKPVDETAATEWVPPGRPLTGDKGQSHLYTHVEEAEELRRIEKELQLLDQDTSPTTVVAVEEAAPVEEAPSVDWLKTRRAMLAGQPIGLKMMKPQEAASAKHAMVDDIPVKEHMLLSRKEIAICLEAMGGQDIQVVLDAPGVKSRMGGPKGIILVTGTNHTQLRTLADTLVRQLRRRKLQDVGVLGAEVGADGNLDDPNENWFVVDCRNYIVHIQDAKTRKAVNLEGLWSGKDGLHRVDMSNDEAVENYVASHPVPHDYTGGGSAYFAGDWDDTLKQLEKNRWTTPRGRPVVPKRKRKTSGRKS